MQFTPIHDDKVQIYLLFYRPASDDHFQNRLVAFFDAPFCHVEMAFPEKYGIEPWEKEVWGTSIYQGDFIFYKTKTYQREGYFSFAIEVTRAQSIKIKKYCQMQAESNVPFSKLAMYSAYLPIQLFDVQGSFCSKHVTLALQEGGVSDVMHLNPCLVTPSSLYKTLLLKSSKCPIVQVVPSKMQANNCGGVSSHVPSSSSSSSPTVSVSVNGFHHPNLFSKMANDLIINLRDKGEEKKSSKEPTLVLGHSKVQQSMTNTFLKQCLLTETKPLLLLSPFQNSDEIKNC